MSRNDSFVRRGARTSWPALLIGAVLAAPLGCSPRASVTTVQKQDASIAPADPPPQDMTTGGATMVEIDPAVSTALQQLETTGKLGGMEFEYYVGGGLPPPYYVSEQFRLLTKAGHDTFQFATPDFSKPPSKDESYPRDVYTLIAQPEDVKSLARLLREDRAFAAPESLPRGADSVRTEIVLKIGAKRHTAMHAGRDPESLERLNKQVQAFVALTKSKGHHELQP